MSLMLVSVAHAADVQRASDMGADLVVHAGSVTSSDGKIWHIAPLAAAAAFQKPEGAGLCLARVEAQNAPDVATLARWKSQGLDGLLIDTGTAEGARLLAHLTIAHLAALVSAAHALGLICGFSGALEAPDVPRLLSLNPDILGFRLDILGEKDVRIIRDLIPSKRIAPETKLDRRVLPVRPQATERNVETDRIFVHDLVLEASIGAYDFERGITQKVRFNVDVDVTRVPHHGDDMREVFSYDLIIDAIHLILGHGHVALVETLAEHVAESVLSHPRVQRAIVKVEKLSVINGAVGVEIRRERLVEAARIHKLFPDAAEN